MRGIFVAAVGRLATRRRKTATKMKKVPGEGPRPSKMVEESGYPRHHRPFTRGGPAAW